uniref:Uncharacterized protein n=1 Tax=Timema tahoe TaxID=61484 RepID=A0A7R9IHG7_9NEOP|nr:unnamed protein product [Timema tahoe]
MKSVCNTAMALVAVVVVLVVVTLTEAKEERYTSRYDNVDVERILQSARLLDNYMKCLLEKGPCTPDGKEMKSLIQWLHCLGRHSRNILDDDDRDIEVRTSVGYTEDCFSKIVFHSFSLSLSPRKFGGDAENINIKISLVLEKTDISKFFRKTCPVASAIYGFRDPSVLVGLEGYFDLLPDALKTDCEKCTEKQRTTSQKVMKHLMKTRPDDWAKLTKKYDPEGLYRSRYSALIVEHMSGRA